MAGEDVGALVARMVADTEGLRADMAKAQRQVNSATGRINRSLANVDKRTAALSKGFGFLRTAITGAATVMAVRFVKASLDASAQMLDTAQKVGVGVEALQSLRFAAMQYGIQQSVTDMALQRFSRRIGEAVQGQGELLKTVQQYNLQLTDSQGRTRSLEAILGDYAEVVKNAESQQEALRLAFKAFDSEGAALVTMLRGGRDALTEFDEEARRLGVVMSEEVVRKARQGSIDLNVMANVMRTQVLVAVGENAEAFSKFGEVMTSAFTAAIEGVGTLLEKLQNLGVAISHLASGDKGGAQLALAGAFQQGGAQGPPAAGGAGGQSPFAAPTFGNAPGMGGGGAQGQGIGPGPTMMNFEFMQTWQESWTEAIQAVGQEWVTHYEAVNMMAEDHTARQVREAKARAEAEKSVAQERMLIEQSVSNAAIGLLAAVGSEHKGAAIAALAIQKALAVKEILINSEVAAMNALATLPYPGNIAVAAGVRAMGKVSAGLVAATGFVEVGQISRGTAGLGTQSQPLFTRDVGSPTTQAGQQAIGGASAQRAVNITFQGPFIGWNEQTRRNVVEALREAVNDFDEVFIKGNSRQASEILRGR